MKKLAFIFTEYQQNIVIAICLQQSERLDIVFVRKNIAFNPRISELADQVIYVEDIPYSWRSISRYYREYKKVISPHLNRGKEYRVLTPSIENPIIRLTISELKEVQLQLFEDGVGSYVSWGRFFWNSGLKAFLASFLIFLLISVLTFQVQSLRRHLASGWALYAGCFPEFDIDKKIIEHHYFQEAVRKSMPDSGVAGFESDTKVFIQQPYVEMSILSDEEYVEIHIEAVLKIKHSGPGEIKKIVWKLHPRTIVADEQKRLDKINEVAGVKFQMVKDRCSMEHIALANKNSEIQYYSLGSSSLYVIKALTTGANATFLVWNKKLTNRLSSQSQVNDLYKSIGIGFV